MPSATPRQDGKAPNIRTQSVGEGPMNGRTRDQLYNVAKELGIIGRGHMSRAELLQNIEKYLPSEVQAEDAGAE